MSGSHLRGLLVAALSAGLLGCGADRITGPSVDELTSRVKALGFSVRGMQDNGSYIIVEGDIRLEKAILLQGLPESTEAPSSGIRPPQSAAYQYRTTTTVSSTYVRQITVDLTNISAISNWASAVRTAMAAYNASGSAVNMSEASPGDITFFSVSSLPGDGIAVASWPYEGSPSGKPGPDVTVAEDFNSLALNQKEWVMVHELGHTLGLRHDDSPDLNEDHSAGVHLISGTPPEDPNSVMRYFLGSATWVGFSQYDVIALKTMYNPINVTITGPSYIASQRTCTWTGNASGAVPPYTYSWYVQQPGTSYFSPYTGTQQSFVSTGNNYSQISFPITLTVTDATGWSNTTAAYVTSYGPGGYYDSTYCY